MPDNCPTCGRPTESTQELVNTHVMNRFVRLKDKAVGVFNNGADRFTVAVDTGKKNELGEVVKEKLEWVKESVYLAEQDAARLAPAAKVEEKKVVEEKKAPATPPKAVVEAALAAEVKPVGQAIQLG
jgi:hypothetical protein